MYTLMVTFVFVSRQLKHLWWNCEVPFSLSPKWKLEVYHAKILPKQNLYPLLSFWWLETVQTASFSYLPLADFSPQWQHDFYECNHQQTCNPNSPIKNLILEISGMDVFCEFQLHFRHSGQTRPIPLRWMSRSWSYLRDWPDACESP